MSWTKLDRRISFATLARVLFPVCCFASIAFAAAPQTAFGADVIDSVLVEKANRTMSLLSHGKVIKKYRISLGFEPLGAKTQQGDGRTPEGKYRLDFRNSKSQFYKSLHISYPNAKDRESARKRHVSPGGDVFVHGLGSNYSWVESSHTLRDWTAGCIAVTNQEIDEIWKLVKDGTEIEIRP